MLLVYIYEFSIEIMCFIQLSAKFEKNNFPYYTPVFLFAVYFLFFLT